MRAQKGRFEINREDISSRPGASVGASAACKKFVISTAAGAYRKIGRIFPYIYICARARTHVRGLETSSHSPQSIKKIKVSLAYQWFLDGKIGRIIFPKLPVSSRRPVLALETLYERKKAVLSLNSFLKAKRLLARRMQSYAVA